MLFEIDMSTLRNISSIFKDKNREMDGVKSSDGPPTFLVKQHGQFGQKGPIRAKLVALICHVTQC